ERAAFLAGQSEAQTVHEDGPVVTIVGPVKYHLVQWTKDLTVANAILQAGYFGKGDPRSITIIRNGARIPINPQDLLAGKDFSLLSGDVLLID
ncbi:MAG TPA: hypothetical protein VKA67_03370, partial [Verrucomicrobiae bacterium]|nr:hypothetical protein [Verrucomicrobiae bacterium]